MESTKGPESAVPSDGKEDSFQKPTDHGAIAFASEQTSSLTSKAEYHTWTFTLSANASVTAKTLRADHAKTLDTVVYLYKQNADGKWGSYIARNDDADSSTVLSSLTKSLGAGTYRVLVKGYDEDVRGKFGVEVDCSGAGCGGPDPAGCLFGDNQDDFQNRTNPDLLINDPVRVTDPAMLAGMHGVSDARIVAAMNESGWNVTTVAEAFSHADGGEFDIVYVYDLAGARSFVAVEYGAGDNPYGAIFAEDTGPEVAALKDSDIDNCTVEARTCALHQNIGDLKSDATWVKVSSQRITDPAALTGTQAANALQAIRVAYSDATTLAEGFGDIDEGELDLDTLKKGDTVVEVYDYGAGDNPYGAIFVAGTTTLAAEMHDGDFYGCTIDQ